MILDLIENYTPKNTQEKHDKETIITFLKHHPNALHRENTIGHITSSAIVVNKTMTKVLFAYHKIYDSWAWVGGHNDGEENPLKVAIKETKEETGLETVTPYSEDIFMLDVINVKTHQKNGTYIDDHLHLNITYLLIASEDQSLTPSPDENLAVKWFNIDDVLKAVKEDRMIPIYQKAFNEIKQLRRNHEPS